MKAKPQERKRTRLGLSALLAYLQSLPGGTEMANRRFGISCPGFPLRIPVPTERTPEEKARKKSMRQKHRARISRRGY